MSNEKKAEGGHDDFSREEMQSALFAQLVIQQSNMAMMLMGKTAHPETGETIRDLETARFFIDQLEMLEHKTRGNLDNTEQSLLKQTLMALRMAFVEAVEQPKTEKQTTPESKGTEDSGKKQESPIEPSATEESKKRFSKKFSL